MMIVALGQQQAPAYRRFLVPLPKIYRWQAPPADRGGFLIFGSGRVTSTVHTWSYPEMLGFMRGSGVAAGKVRKHLRVEYITDGRTLDVDLTPDDRIERLGLCKALKDLENGFWIAWERGPFFVEPGAFAPGKSWSDVVRDSIDLRQGKGERWQLCCDVFTESIAKAKDRCEPRGPSDATAFIISTSRGGDAACEQAPRGSGASFIRPWTWFGTTARVTSSWSASLRKHFDNSIAISNIARWIDRFSTGRPSVGRDTANARMFCVRRSAEQRGVAWGHQFVFYDTAVAKFGPNGILQRERLRFEEPILSIPTGAPGYPREWRLNPTEVKDLIREGNWPPRQMRGTAGKWLDTGESFFPDILLHPEGTDEGGIQPAAFAAIVGGGIALALALTAGG